jgi:hypothetical protein
MCGLEGLEGPKHEVRMFLLCEQADAGSLETEVQDSSGRVSEAQTNEAPGFAQLAPGVPGRVGGCMRWRAVAKARNAG